jgi:hypothetical protein
METIYSSETSAESNQTTRYYIPEYNTLNRLRVLLRKLSGPRREGMTERWRKLQVHNLHSLQNIIRVIKSRRMRGAENVVNTREKINAYKIFIGKTYGKRSLE